MSFAFKKLRLKKDDSVGSGMISNFANMPSLKALFWNASADKKQRKRGGRRGKKKAT